MALSGSWGASAGIARIAPRRARCIIRGLPRCPQHLCVLAWRIAPHRDLLDAQHWPASASRRRGRGENASRGEPIPAPISRPLWNTLSERPL